MELPFLSDSLFPECLLVLLSLSSRLLATASDDVAHGIVFLVPLRDLGVRNSDELVHHRPIIQLHYLLPHLVATKKWQHIDPQPIVEDAEQYDPNAHHAVRPIPEANITTSGATRRRIPRHDEQEQVDSKRNDDGSIPTTKLAASGTNAAALAANEVEAKSHEEKEYG